MPLPAKEDDDARHLGPTLYEGPPFGVSFIYGAPAFDTTERTSVVGSIALTVSVSISSGVTTTARRVTVERIHGPNALEPSYLVGFCHLRQGIRHFRVDRIRELTPAGASHAEPGVSWYLRRIIARSREERPLIRNSESVVLAAGIGKPVVIHWRRERWVDESGKPVHAEWDGGEINMPPGRWDTRVEVYDVEIDVVMQSGESMRIVGKAKRRPGAGIRPWSGEKTFYLRDCEAFETPDWVRIEDPREFLYEAAGLAPSDRPMLLASNLESAEQETTLRKRPELTPGGSGTVQVKQRDRRLKKRTETNFYLGREEFEDTAQSPSGRYLTGVSEGSLQSDDMVPGVALVDTQTGIAPFVLRFRRRPRWPRVNDAGLLLVREVAWASAILHAFDSEGKRRWNLTLPTTHDLAEFSADGQLVAIVSGLFWRRSNSDVWTWLVRADTGDVVATLDGTDALRATQDGRCEITGPTGAVTFLCPPGMLERVLEPEYVAEWRTRPS
jgi:hypothetical protein